MICDDVQSTRRQGQGVAEALLVRYVYFVAELRRSSSSCSSVPRFHLSHNYPSLSVNLRSIHFYQSHDDEPRDSTFKFDRDMIKRASRVKEEVKDSRLTSASIVQFSGCGAVVVHRSELNCLLDRIAESMSCNAITKINDAE